MVADGATCLETARKRGIGHATTVYNWLPETIERAKSYPSRKKRKLKRMKQSNDTHAYDGFEGTLEEKIARLELENDILKEVVEVLKAASLKSMTNREKTLVINSLRQKTARPLK